MRRVGIIGGSGLDDPAFVEDVRDHSPTTEYGPPSGPIRCGVISGVEVALLGRHGPEHTLPPGRVPYRANIRALAGLGCAAILATTAVGSLRDEIRRGDLVILDQFIDFTRNRTNTFHETFAPGNPVHTSMADPFDARLRGILCDNAERLGYRFHPRGTVVTIEGPRFSTRAESFLFRQWGADVINMSIATEAALAAEAGIPYAVVAMSTDYDCWKADETPVGWEEILRVFAENAERVTKLLTESVKEVARIADRFDEATNR